MQFNYNNYSYTKDWFINSELHKYLLNHVNPNRKLTILEIGCYEGLSSCFFSDILLNHPESTLNCVDPFSELDPTTPVTKDTESLFYSNISKSKNYNKIKVHKDYSNNFFKSNSKIYNLIYIDGSHSYADVVSDLRNAFEYSHSNGIIWMDDYLGKSEVKNAIDAVLNEYNGKYELIHSGYQIAIIKKGYLKYKSKWKLS